MLTGIRENIEGQSDQIGRLPFLLESNCSSIIWI